MPLDTKNVEQSAARPGTTNLSVRHDTVKVNVPTPTTQSPSISPIIKGDNGTTLEPGSKPAARSASVDPQCLEGGRPAGLVSIRFFASTGHTPTGPGPAPIVPSKPDPPLKQSKTVFMPPSAYPVQQPRRGRGRPRTKSAEPVLIADKASILNQQRPPAQSLPRLFGSSGELKLPRIAPKPPSSQPMPPFGLIQPNTMQQARTLMSKIPASSSNDRIVFKPYNPPMPLKVEEPSPELDVLRLISDACEIHENDRSRPSGSNKPIDDSRRKKIRKVLPRKEISSNTNAPVLVEPRLQGMKRKLLPKPPVNKMPLPSPRHQQS